MSGAEFMHWGAWGLSVVLHRVSFSQPVLAQKAAIQSDSLFGLAAKGCHLDDASWSPEHWRERMPCAKWDASKVGAVKTVTKLGGSLGGRGGGKSVRRDGPWNTRRGCCRRGQGCPRFLACFGRRGFRMT